MKTVSTTGVDGPAGGTVCEELLVTCLADNYFGLAIPKSTGTDYFNGDWLDRALARVTAPVAAQDVQATLAELTARSIAAAFVTQTPGTLAVCGGGAHNRDLVTRLQQCLPSTRVESTTRWGMEPDLG